MASQEWTAMPRLLVSRQAQQTGSNQNKGSNSVSGMVSTLAPTFLISVAILFVFLILSRRLARVYQPRTYLASLRRRQLSPKQSSGVFGWLKEYAGMDDDFVLAHASIDNFLWLRMFKMLALMCFVGCLITWPVLFPVNITGGGGQEGLDILTFSNVTPGPRYYAQTFVAWAFLSWVMFMITRELLYATQLRQQYLTSPFESSRISTRTVLFTNVPEELRNEERLRKEYDGVRAVWLVSVPEELDEKVDDRDKAATKLENSEVKLLKNFVKKQMKKEKKANKKGDHESAAVARDEERNEIALDKKDRPTHRLPVLKFLPFGKKVDSISWSRNELQRLIPEVERGQQNARNDRSKVQGACFIEFESVDAARAVFRKSDKKNKVKMTPAEMGPHPDNVIWKNTVKSAAVTKTLSIVCTAFIWFLCIFWSIPVAAIGAISNINYLIETVPFLSFLNSLPDKLMGIVTGLLPVLLLSVLMLLVPIICNILARQFEPTESLVQMKVQGWYFPFQVIQVFLITTFSSGASSAAGQIYENPSAAVNLLAENLPKASNFYISYFILFGLITAAMQLLNLAPLLFFLILGKILDTTPRKMYNRYVKLSGLGWGSLYPKFTNLGVIALAYSSIAPLVLGFATIGFVLLYLAFRYNAFFTLGTDVSTHGASYTRALLQMTTGIYISELCLIGLFGIGIGNTLNSIGPLVLMVVFLVATIVWQVWLMRKIHKMEEEYTGSNNSSLAANGNSNGNGNGHQFNNNNGRPSDVEKAPGAMRDSEDTYYKKSHSPSDGGEVPRKDQDQDQDHQQQHVPDMQPKPTLMERIKGFFHPTAAAQNTVQTVWPLLQAPVRPYTQQEHDEAYLHPAIVSECPIVWMPRDSYGLSRQEVNASKQTVGTNSLTVTDEEAWFTEKGKIEWRHEDEGDLRRVPIWEEEPVY